MKKMLCIVAGAFVLSIMACTKNTTKPNTPSLYEVLTNEWKIASATKIDDGVVSYPGRGRYSGFCFKADTTVSYVGIGQEWINPTKYTIKSFNQFTFDTTKVTVTIFDFLNIGLSMESINNPVFKKEIMLRRGN